MDVRCARCGIEYEFDDALISDRGTMVRCTECGHQFRVHPSHVIPGAPDEWRITTPDGQTIVYLTLRELQQGITQGQVGRDANLTRGNGPQRPLGTIAELDPFFPTRAAETRQQSTLTGVAPPSLIPSGAPTPPPPPQNTGKMPIARIGLTTVQVSASGVALEPPRPENRPRKTTLGMGEDPQKMKQVADDARAAAHGAPSASADMSGADHAGAKATEEPNRESATSKATQASALVKEESSKVKLAPAGAKIEEASKIRPAPAVPRQDVTFPDNPEPLLVAKDDATKPKQESTLPKIALGSPKLAEAAALGRPIVQRQQANIENQLEPTTLRNADTQETPAVQKRAATLPPRPDRPRSPTPAAGAPVVASHTKESDNAVALPLTHKTPSVPPTDPPPAQRIARDESQYQKAETLLEKTEPLTMSRESAPNLTEKLPPATDTKSNSADESLALEFKAESPPLEHATSLGTAVTSAPAIPHISDPLEAGSFAPTVPPKRSLSNGDGSSPQTRARSLRMGRWLLGGLSITLLALAAFWMNFRNQPPSVSHAASAAPTLEQYLSGAAEALHGGDLGRAHDQLQSSQTLGGRDPRWIVLTARYDVMRADMNWLAVRLGDPNDTTRTETLKRELSEHVLQASRAMASIERLAMKDADLVAAHVDAQRLRGELDEARKSAEVLRQSNPSPEIAYALAGLELVAEKPNYKDVFDWLGKARAADSGLGRAPAMLVLACVMSQRLDCARAELGRLKSAPKTHPLLPEIEAFINRAQAKAASTANETNSAPVVDAGAGPLPSASPNASAPSEPAGDATVTTEGDFRLRLRRGLESLRRNELTRAEQMFRSVVAERPSDTEALTGLGDVARRRNNTTSAISYYQKVLASNGQYLPALSALADLKWNSGDRTGAVQLYRRIIDQVGESSSYGRAAAQRLRELSEGSAKPVGAADTEKAVAPAASSKSDLTRRAGQQP